MATHMHAVPYDDNDLFPSWRNLPFNADTCIGFLAEIQQCDKIKGYPTIVKDREGAEVIVDFYPESYNGFDFNKLKRGHTLMIMNATQHNFLDGKHGVRVNDMDDVHVVPLGLQAFRELGPDVLEYATGSESEEWKCHGCGASKPIGQMSRCGGCRVFAYCNKECQVKGWAEKGHKSSCKVMRGPRLSSLLKLDFPSDPPSIPSASSVVESAIRELRSLGLLGTR